MNPQSTHDDKCPQKKPHVHWFQQEDKWRVEVYNVKATLISKDSSRHLGATFDTEDAAVKCHDMWQVAINLRGLKGT